MDHFNELELFLAAAWSLLNDALVEDQHPMRWFTFGTTDLNNSPDARFVVLRKVRAEQRQLDIFTDIRSTKIQHLNSNPKASLVFYHPEESFQIRARASVVLHHQDEPARAGWQSLPLMGKKNYAADPGPGTPLTSGHDAMPDWWSSNPPPEQLSTLFKHFVIIRCTVESLDCLLLHRAGHQRAVFNWTHGAWKGKWVVP